MTRLCISHTHLNISKLKNGSYVFEGWPKHINRAKEWMALVEPSQVTAATYNSICNERLEQNLSDVAITYSTINGGAYYYVPVAIGETCPAIISGYEVNDYINSQLKKQWKNGFFDNLRAFDASTYMVLVSIIFVLFLVKCCANYLFYTQLKTWPRDHERTEQQLTLKKGTHLQPLVLLAHVLFFLIATPFLNLYNTSQVVTEKPQVILDYETIIKSNKTIFSGMTNNVETYFKPSEFSIRNNDITFRFYNYFKNKHINSKKHSAIKNKDFIQYILYDFILAKLTVDKKLIYITHYWTALQYRRFFCALSSEDKFFRLFTSIDESQRKILMGHAFRSGFHDSMLVRRMRISTEFASLQGGHAVTVFDVVNKLDQNALIRPEDRRQQLEYCMDETITAYSKEKLFATGLQFFRIFWSSLALIILLAFCVLKLERTHFSSVKKAEVHGSRYRRERMESRQISAGSIPKSPTRQSHSPPFNNR